jgi:hypothetical protein
MAFVIATALFFAIIDVVLLKFLIYLSKFRRALSPRIERWIQDGVLQLQRRAYEAHKEGTWSELSKEVPLTKSKELLAELPLASLPSGNSTPVLTLPNRSQSRASAASQSTQAQTIISQPTPTQPTPTQPTPTQPTPTQPTPTQPTPTQPTPPQPATPQSTPPQPTPLHPVQP